MLYAIYDVPKLFHQDGFKIFSSYNCCKQLIIFVAYSNVLVESINVLVKRFLNTTIGQEVKELLVTIEKSNVKKPFIGGYRNKVTGLEYHHAAVQTMPKGKVDNGVSPFH